jgi:hypothetical protein
MLYGGYTVPRLLNGFLSCTRYYYSTYHSANHQPQAMTKPQEKDPSDGKASTSGLRPRSLTILIGLGS